MAKKRKKGVIRRLKVVMTNGEDKILNVLTNANPDKSDAELVKFVQDLNALSSNNVEKITRIDVEDITKAIPANFEKAEGIAVFNENKRLIAGKIPFADNSSAQDILNGAELTARQDGADISNWTVAVWECSEVDDSGYKFADNDDAAAMLNDTLGAHYKNDTVYTIGMITSDGKLTDSGVKFASKNDINEFMKTL